MRVSLFKLLQKLGTFTHCPQQSYIFCRLMAMFIYGNVKSKVFRDTSTQKRTSENISYLHNLFRYCIYWSTCICITIAAKHTIEKSLRSEEAVQPRLKKCNCTSMHERGPPPVLSEPRPLQENRCRRYLVRWEAAKKKTIFLLYLFFLLRWDSFSRRNACVQKSRITWPVVTSNPNLFYANEMSTAVTHPHTFETDARRKIYLWGVTSISGCMPGPHCCRLLNWSLKILFYEEVNSSSPRHRL